MRLLAYTICIFIILTIISALSYFYVILFYFLQNPSMNANKHLFANIIDSSMRSSHLSSSNILIVNVNNTSYDLGFNNTNYDKISISKLNNFKNRLIVKLRRSESDLSSSIMRLKDSQNLYKVRFKGKKNSNYANKQLLCTIPVVLLRNITKKLDLDLKAEDHKMNVFPLNFKEKTRPICAMVSNSGALTDSHLGKEIDSHDIVLRFNNAPTDHYIEDVGNKTTIRILNSQLLLNESFNVSKSDLYRNLVKFVWDASDYDLDLNKWIHKRKRFFEAYKQLENLFPEEKTYIIHPQMIWKSWDALQCTTSTTMPKNPPSSGFLGIVILLKICSKVDIYEYIPSMRMNDKCHYYDNTINIGCTFGQWHPLSTEKLFIISINEANDYESLVNGKVSLSGCDL